MEVEDAADFGDAVRVLVGAVVGGDDFFRGRAVEVGAPVGHEAVGAGRLGAVEFAALAAVAHDRVVGDGGGDGQLVDLADEAVVRGEGVDAVRRAVELERGVVGGHDRGDGVAGVGEEGGHADQAGAEAADPVGGEFRAAVGGGDEDGAVDVLAVAEDDRVAEDLAAGAGDLDFIRALAEEAAPDAVAGIGADQAAGDAAHAVADDDDVLVVGEGAVDAVEFLAEQGGGVGVGVAAGVAEDPELVLFANLRVLHQRVVHRRPGGGGVLEAVDHEDGDAVFVVLLEAHQARGVGVFLGIEQADQAELVGPGDGHGQGDRGAEVGGEGRVAAGDADLFDVERVVEFEDGAALVVAAEDGGEGGRLLDGFEGPAVVGIGR